jgi:general secretion pathway protein M
MSAANAFNAYKERINLMWLGRTEQERKFLSIGGLVVGAALFFMIFIGPALNGRAQLKKSIPTLRQDAATMQALALEAGALAGQGAVQVTPMTREALMASLSASGITPTSLTVTGEFAKLDLAAVPFANLAGWLDAQRREHRISVQEAIVTAQTPAGQVDASITLRQNIGAQ